MKRVVLTLLLLLMTTTVWASVDNLEQKVKSQEITVEMKAMNMPLEKVLTFISKQCGIQIMAVPEVADIKVDIEIVAGQKVEQILDLLQQKYQLTWEMKSNAILVYKATFNTKTFAMSALGTMAKGNMQPRMAYEMAPVGNYNAYIPMNKEEYKGRIDNQFQDPLKSTFSTFSIDVDTASYSNVRRFINSGKLPGQDTVRTEEMVNYFNYDYKEPIGEHPFSVTTEVSTCPWAPEHKLVMIGLQGKNIPMEEMPPSNLIFLIDVSGSMSDANKLPLLKTAFKMLVKQLRPQDKVSIVVYAGKAGLVLEPTFGSEKDKITKGIEDLQAGGSTAGGEGIQLAYKIAKEQFIKGGNNRVILATDGDFNVGVTNETELTTMIEERRDDGIFLSILGFGMGNLKDGRMETLADKGNGNYAYIDNALEAKKVMVGQMAGTLYTIAKDVKLQVEFNPEKVKNYRLIGYENRILENSDFNNDKKDAGDMGAGHTVTALYEIIPVGAKEMAGSVDAPVYQRSEVLGSDDLLQVKIRYKKPNENTSILLKATVRGNEETNTPSENFRFAAAVTEYAMLLRNSEYKGQANYEQLLALAKGAKGRDEQGYRGEFIKIAEVSQLLAEK